MENVALDVQNNYVALVTGAANLIVFLPKVKNVASVVIEWDVVEEFVVWEVYAFLLNGL